MWETETINRAGVPAVSPPRVDMAGSVGKWEGWNGRLGGMEREMNGRLGGMGRKDKHPNWPLGFGLGTRDKHSNWLLGFGLGTKGKHSNWLLGFGSLDENKRSTSNWLLAVGLQVVDANKQAPQRAVDGEAWRAEGR